MQFIDLKTQYGRYREEIRAEMDRVLDSGQYIQGPVVAELEAELAAYVGVPHAVACSSGTDALLLALMALELKAGDEVIVPDFTFFATAEAVSLLGGVPVFADVRADTLNLDPERAAEVIGPRTRGIIAVSLYGRCADFDELNELAARHGLFLVEDGAQSFGASSRGRRSCGLTPIAATSFYPAKPLGAYGDGGALFTREPALAARFRSLLNHGQVASYRHRHIGINGRLDALQAAVLRVKLRHLDEELAARQRAAEWYREELSDAVEVPHPHPGDRCAWAQYTVRTPRRDRLAARLAAAGIPTAVHYPLPVHRQEAYAGLAADDGRLAESIRAAGEVLSLPMHPFLTREQVAEVGGAVRAAVWGEVGSPAPAGERR